MPTKKEIHLINLKQLADRYPNDKTFSNAVGIKSPGQLSSMLKGERNLTKNMAARIVNALDLDADYFDTLHQPIEEILGDPGNQELVEVLLAPYSIPLIYWTDIDAWLKFSQKKRASNFPDAVTRLPAGFKSETPQRAFYLRNESRAMSPRLQEGDLLGIDTTQREPQHNDFVLVRLRDKSFRVRQYRFQIGNQEPYLRSLRDASIIRWCDKPEIIGIVVHRCTDLLERAV